MADLIKIALIFTLMIFLLRRKWNVGTVMLLASGSLSVLYLLSPAKVFLAIRNTISSKITWELIIVLTFIRFLEAILRESNILGRMMQTMKALLRNPMAVTVSMPLLIGMLPSVGGAYFSAPMVDEATSGTDLTPEEKTFLNYWYRHPWELILPLYPGIVLATLLTSVDLRRYILINLPAALTMVAGGYLFTRKIKREEHPKTPLPERFLLDFLPIIFLFLMVIVFNLSLSLSIVLMVIVLLLILRYPPKKVKHIVKNGFSLNVVLLILGVISFKETLEVSGAVNNLSLFFTELSIPTMTLLFFLPFITGLLTGITVGFVSSSFPLLLSLIGNDPAGFGFAFTAGYVGVLLSPVHVCLILTREYFHADMGKSYRKIIPAAALVLLVAISEYLLLR